MDAMRSKVMSFVGRKDNVVNIFLGAAFVVLGVRSMKQQEEIEALEAEKSSLRSSNKAMSSAMWEWRQNLFHLAEADPPSLPISISRLRAIYGEDEAPTIQSSIKVLQWMKKTTRLLLRNSNKYRASSSLRAVAHSENL